MNDRLAAPVPRARRLPRLRLRLPSAALLLVLATTNVLPGQEPGGAAPSGQAPGDASTAGPEHEDLAKQLQNPFADLITLPLQNITSLGVGPDDGRQNVLNLQPVVPVHLDEDWNLIARPILPVSSTSVPQSEFGLGDFNLEPFLSPRKGGTLVWGVGVIVGVPRSLFSSSAEIRHRSFGLPRSTMYEP